jgi:hypothetical protein
MTEIGTRRKTLKTVNGRESKIGKTEQFSTGNLNQPHAGYIGDKALKRCSIALLVHVQNIRFADDIKSALIINRYPFRLLYIVG